MKKMNGFISAAACTVLLAGFGAMTFSARAAENETADIPGATAEYTGTLPVASESVVTTVTERQASTSVRKRYCSESLLPMRPVSPLMRQKLSSAAAVLFTR